MHKILFFFLTVLLTHSLYSQNIEIKGKITDKITNLPINSASVQVEKYGVKSDANGSFTLNIDKSIVTKNGITITSIGYVKQQINFQTNMFFIIQLDLANTTLSEVIVGGNAETIIKKAINRIPQNYPSSDFTMDGIIRIYRTEIDSPKCYKYFSSDAVVKLFYPSYSNTEQNPEIAVVQNKSIYLQPYQAAYEPDIWVNGYQVNDFIHKNADFINPSTLNEFKYKIVNKIVLNSSKVWVVGFQSKRKKHIEGTLYIDTASFAFVYANYNYYNIRKLFHRTIEKTNITILFKKVGTKWYLNTKNTKTNYLFSRAKFSASFDFVCTNIDTSINISPIKSKELVKNLEEDLKIHKPASEINWAVYDSIFKKAQDEKTISYIPLPEKKAITVSKEKQIIDEDDIPYNKRIGFLEEARIRFSLSIEKINVKSSKLPKGTIGAGFSIGFKIYPNTYLQVPTTFNFQDANGVSTNTEGLIIYHSININNKFKPIYFSPSFGITFLQLLQDKKYVKYINQITVGTSLSIPIKPILRSFVNFSYNKIISDKGTLQTYSYNPLSISTGIYFSF